LRNANKYHLILAKFYVNNALFVNRQSTKFQLNLLSKQFSYRGLCEVSQKKFLFHVFVEDVRHKDLKLKCFAVLLFVLANSSKNLTL